MIIDFIYVHIFYHILDFKKKFNQEKMEWSFQFWSECKLFVKTFMIKTAPILVNHLNGSEKILSGHWFSMKIRLEARLNLSNLQVYFWRKLEVTYRRFLRACRRRLLYAPVNPARYLPILRCCCCSDEASKLVAPCQTIEGCWEFDYRTHQDH